MAWIELHQAVWTHRKTLLLATALDLPETYAAAHVSRLWCWALDNAPEGDLSHLPCKVIAYGADWHGDPAQFVDALVNAGWLDREENGWLELHDWADYAGRLIAQRKQSVERARTWREAHSPPLKSESAPNAQRTRSVQPTVPDPTGPDSTGPDSTKTRTAPAAARAHASAPRENAELENHAAAEDKSARSLFEHYRQKVQPQARVFPGDKIKRRLKSFSAAEVTQSIDHFAADEWQRDHNHARGASWFFDSDARIEHYLHMEPNQEHAHATTARRNGHDAREPAGTTRVRPGERPLDQMPDLGF